MNNLIEDRKNLIIACLLHDIGKLIQRADDNPSKKTHQEFSCDWLKEKTHNSLDELIYNILLTHHALKSSNRKSDNLSVFKNESNYTLIAYESDNLSSKERMEEDEEINEYAEWESEIALTSIFSKISFKHTNEKAIYNDCWKYLELEPLGEKINYPKDNVINSQIEYKELLSEFEKDFNKINSNLNINNLLIILEKYLSNVPSLTKKVRGVDNKPVLEKYPDISLFDHAKNTAAIANCIFNYFCDDDDYRNKLLNNEILKTEILDTKVYKYLLVGCDISGVQNFIYTISSKYALKSLKARSFYLELLCEHVANEILNKLNLFRTNIIYLGGGGFYILTQNSNKAKESIDNIKEEMNSWLYQEFEGKLYLNLEYIPFSGIDLNLNENKSYGIQKIWKNLSEKIDDSKKRKYYDKDNNKIFNKIFSINEASTSVDSCTICHTDTKPLYVYKDEYESNDIMICESCKSLIDIGKIINSVKYIYQVPLSENCIKESNYLIINNYKYLFFKKNPEKDFQHDNIYIINSWDIKNYDDDKKINLNIGNYYYNVKDLNELADESIGVKNIAVLRMDVDNLGMIFSQGIHKSEATFSRMSSLSRNLSLFFKYYLNLILKGDLNCITQISMEENKKDKSRKSIIIYSGGDDLFIIGSWNELPELAIDIHECFKKFTSENIDIGISAGITIHEPYTPIYQMARLSHSAEESAKSKITNRFNKNNIAFLYDETLSFRNERIQKITGSKETILESALKWDDFIKLFQQTKSLYKIYDNISHSNILKLYKLLNIWQIEGKLYLPLMNYTLNKIKQNSNLDDADFNKIFTGYMSPSIMNTLHVSLNWLEYLKK